MSTRLRPPIGCLAAVLGAGFLASQVSVPGWPDVPRALPTLPATKQNKSLPLGTPQAAPPPLPKALVARRLPSPLPSRPRPPARLARPSPPPSTPAPSPWGVATSYPEPPATALAQPADTAVRPWRFPPLPRVQPTAPPVVHKHDPSIPIGDLPSKSTAPKLVRGAGAKGIQGDVDAYMQVDVDAYMQSTLRFQRVRSTMALRWTPDAIARLHKNIVVYAGDVRSLALLVAAVNSTLAHASKCGVGSSCWSLVVLTETSQAHEFLSQHLSTALAAADIHYLLFDDFPFGWTHHMYRPALRMCSNYARFLFDILLPFAQRVLWLDTDTIVQADVQELFDLDMQGHATATVPDCKKKFSEQ
eukprot:gene7207-175_t